MHISNIYLDTSIIHTANDIKPESVSYKVSLRQLEMSILEKENFIDLKHDHLGYYRTAIKGPAQFALATIVSITYLGEDN